MLRSILSKFFASALAFGVVAFSAPTEAQAQTVNTCKCNKGCRVSAGQCLQGSQCKVGYVAVCTNGPGDQGGCGGSTLFCDGTCTCTPHEKFCEFFPDECNAGPQDTGTPDTDVEPSDAFVPDTFVADTFVSQDAYLDDTSYDTYVAPPDAFVPDTHVPPLDTDVGSCAPYPCPAPMKEIFVPHECGPFCVNPARAGDFGCAGFGGTIKVDIDGSNYCVPKCLAPATAAGALTCKDCERCSFGTGECLPDPDDCGDAGSKADGTVSFDSRGPDGFPDGSVVQPDGSIKLPDGSVVQPDGAPVVTDSTVTDSSGGEDTGGTATDGGITDGATDTDFVDPFPGDTGTAAAGRCGCSVPGQSNDSTTLFGAGALAALGIVVARRRRRDAA